MILVTIGTSLPFDRLLSALDGLAEKERVVVQAGASSLRPAGAEVVDFLPFDELVELIESARVVVTHAGAGSVLLSLRIGRRPVVVPRLHRCGEAVDDHQLEFGRRMASLGLVTLVEDPADLDAALAGDEGAAAPAVTAIDLSGELRRYLLERVSAGRSLPRGSAV